MKTNDDILFDLYPEEEEELKRKRKRKKGFYDSDIPSRRELEERLRDIEENIDEGDLPE